MKAKTLRIANTCCCLPECVFVIYIICQGASELRRSSFFTMRTKWGAQIEKMKYFAGRCFIWSERKGRGWCSWGIKGKCKTGSFMLASTSFGEVIEINPASPTYLCGVRCVYFWQRWKCLCLWMCGYVLDVFTCTFVCPWHPQKEYVQAHWCLFVCAYTYKQIKLWASEIFQKTNAGLMPLCDQRIRGFFHYLWQRNAFGCLPASLSLSLSLTLPEGSGECWLSEKCCALENPFNKVEKQLCFGIQESWRLG